MKKSAITKIIFVVYSFLIVQFAMANTLPWQRPNYGSQKNAIGYSADAFPLPKGMEHQVQFWVDVYSKYTTDDCIIHDPDDLDSIFGVINLKELKEMSGIKAGKKEKLIQNRIDAEKKKIAEQKNLKKIKLKDCVVKWD